jgi:outer membrane biosynthesis protein TonB
MKTSAFGFALSALLFAAPALADKVVVLPFHGDEPRAQEARNATTGAVLERAHVPASDDEVKAALDAVGDGSPDTSAEYKQAGNAAKAQWTVTARVENHDWYYRIELEVGQVATGRVESVARNIDPARAPQMISEMLALLLRPEGLGAGNPWANEPPPNKPAPPPPPPSPPPPPHVPPPPPPPAVKHAYAENHPWGVGAGFAVMGALMRPERASGPTASGHIQGFGEYAIDAVSGLAVRAEIAGGIVGPGSFWMGAGARYAIPIVPTIRLFAGPELTLGFFVPIGGDKTARFLLHPSAFVALALGEYVQLEIAPELPIAFGGTGTLMLFGGSARATLRF